MARTIKLKRESRIAVITSCNNLCLVAVLRGPVRVEGLSWGFTCDTALSNFMSSSLAGETKLAVVLDVDSKCKELVNMALHVVDPKLLEEAYGRRALSLIFAFLKDLCAEFSRHAHFVYSESFCPD